MTEVEWLASDDPIPMLDFLRPNVSDRVVRLFACACSRMAWHLMTDERSRLAIEVNERLAEGWATVEERSACWLQANAASLQARRKVAYPEEAATQAFATAAEAAELILFPPGDWPLLKCGVNAAAAALAYEVAATGELPPVRQWPEVFGDEDEEAVAWATRYQEFQLTEPFLRPYRFHRAGQARVLRGLVGNPFEAGGSRC